MPNLSHALVKPDAPRGRLHDLIADLTASGCRFPLTQHHDRIDFDISACALGWVAEGGLERVLAGYADVVVWSGEFYDGHPPVLTGRR